MTLEVEYNLHGADPAVLRDNLAQVARDAYADGRFTDDTRAAIEDWNLRVIGDGEFLRTGHSLPPEYSDANDPSVIAQWLSRLPGGSTVHIDDDGLRLVCGGRDNIYLEIGGRSPNPVAEAEFVESLALEAEGFDAESAFREVCLEQDGDAWRCMEDARNEAPRCQLELEDEGAFCQGLNDHADSMVKDHQWVTFDNGNTYYLAEDVKTVLMGFNGDGRDPDAELKEKLSWFLPL